MDGHRKNHCGIAEKSHYRRSRRNWFVKAFLAFATSTIVSKFISSILVCVQSL